MSLLISVRTDGATTCLAATGDLDVATQDLLPAAVEKALDDGVEAVVVDLTGLSFMDCAGMGGLIRARQVAIARGRTMRISGAHGLPLLVLNTTGVFGHLTT